MCCSSEISRKKVIKHTPVTLVFVSLGWRLICASCDKYKRETFLPVRFSPRQEAGMGGTGKADYCPLLSGLCAPESSAKSRGVCRILKREWTRSFRKCELYGNSMWAIAMLCFYLFPLLSAVVVVLNCVPFWRAQHWPKTLSPHINLRSINSLSFSIWRRVRHTPVLHISNPLNMFSRCFTSNRMPLEELSWGAVYGVHQDVDLTLKAKDWKNY